MAATPKPGQQDLKTAENRYLRNASRDAPAAQGWSALSGVTGYANQARLLLYEAPPQKIDFPRESFETAGAYRRLASEALAQENVAASGEAHAQEIALVVERKLPGVRYSHSHNLDGTAPDLERLNARFREPRECKACNHFRGKATGEHKSFGGATTRTCVGQHFQRTAPFGAK